MLKNKNIEDLLKFVSLSKIVMLFLMLREVFFKGLFNFLACFTCAPIFVNYEGHPFFPELLINSDGCFSFRHDFHHVSMCCEG